jgi:hypothetical protein
MQVTNDLLKDELAAEVASGLVSACKIHLFVLGPPLNANMVPAAFTDAASTGLAAAISPTFSSLYINPDGNWAANSGLILPIVSVVVPETILGWYMTDTTGVFCLAADYFDNPVPITQVGDGVPFVIELAGVSG